jgi:glycosyltransferase involved in cell wall biosynthesis
VRAVTAAEETSSNPPPHEIERPLVVASPHCGVAPNSALGGEVFERMLLTRLPRYGIALEIGLPASRALSDVPEGWRLSLLHPGKGLRWYVAPLAFVPYTVRLLRRGGIDLLRGHSVRYTGPSLLLARRLARSEVPIVLQHLHTDPEWRVLEGPILRRADAVLTISEHSRRQLLELGVPEDRISVVMPGVERPERTTPQDDAWPPAGGLRLLFLSRFVRRKRPHVAVDALAELLQRGVDCSLVMAGDGPLRRSLRQRARSTGVAERISWPGPVSHEKWGLYETADVLLFPSLLEGFGFVVAEAQALGLPVVAARGTATSEIVRDGETGLLVDGDAASFADAVERLAEPGALDTFRSHAREAVERFHWDLAAAQTARVLRGAVETGRR